ncbi:ATP-binding protein [Bacillus infantis]|uniref:ATP-binding protein n=1 Tax=Bacillus infantis TaxID=324767 RepID=UPI0020A134C2|nr:ATP-binding protein [Bacillus infantis]MCP1158685.1 ATP-binding protein [Bacillus infantis]
MITLLKTLLINMTILFSFTFNANLFFPFQVKELLSFKHKLTYGLIGSLGAVFCMLYPIETLGDTHFDFRMIAILIISLYAGPIPGLIVVLVVSLIRMAIGGPFMITGVVVSLLAMLVGLAFRKKYIETSYKLIISSAAFAVYAILYILVIYFNIRFLDLSFYLMYFTAFYITFSSIILIIEKLIKTNKQIEEVVYLDKLTMVGQMAAAIAHEIRNPLTTVRGFIQYLSEKTTDDQVKSFSPLILEELDRTNKIITDYLKIAKPEQFNLTVMNLEKVVRDSVDLLRPLANYIDTSILFEEQGHHFVRGDEHHLKQAIMNVIKNAIESTEKDGQIQITIQANQLSNTVSLKVIDNGIGMTEEQLKKIGLPFYTTKSKGTGLGSMVTNKIVREMDGRIEYESEVNRGTAVTIILPLQLIPDQAH